MWKMSFFAVILATMFLGGCNWGNNAVEETPMQDVKDDVREGVNDVEDAVDPDNPNDVYDNRDVNGDVNNNGVNPNATNPNSNADINGTNGYDNVPNGNGTNGVNGNGNVPYGNTNGTNGVNNEDIIEDKADVRDRDNVDNR